MTQKDKAHSCDMHEALISYLYNEATEEENRRVVMHLNECHACNQEVEAFNRVRGLLQQWQLDDLPVVRLDASSERVPEARRSVLTVLRELLTITPLWAKALGGLATAMLVLAVMGTEVNISGGGLRLRMDIWQRAEPVSAVNTTTPDATAPDLERIRAEVKSMVNTMVAESERRQKEEIAARLVSLESQLHSARSAELAKITARIQEQRSRLKTLERDIDRREGLGLTDILFSEVAPRPGERSAGSDD